MINVKLIAKTDVGPQELASFSAKGCYKDEEPHMGEVMDVETNLFNVGHHTTLQHNYFTFWIEGIAVSDITFGLHLANPFYNSSQRSGRFCAKMFANPDYEIIGGYIKQFWPDLTVYSYNEAINFVRHGIKIYQNNIAKATEMAARLIEEERPFASRKYIDQNAPKFAQEQLRVFIPTIFPTALTITLDLSAIGAMYRSAFSPAMLFLTEKMAGIILSLYPDLEYLFKRDDDIDVHIVQCEESVGIMIKPYHLRIISTGDDKRFIMPEPKDLHPTDLLHFNPKYMDNNTEEIKTEIEISVATMGQDQRHRIIKRGLPNFTGNFYLPPIPHLLGLEFDAGELLGKYFSLLVPKNLKRALAPYGMMVRYRKTASYNAVIHELGKRLCWCAQEEIFHLALKLRAEIIREKEKKSPLLEMFPPSCIRTGKCGEGGRYCGRDLKSDCFVERKI